MTHHNIVGGEGEAWNMDLSSGPALSEAYPEVSFLPLIHDVLHTVEKDTQDPNKKNAESLLATKKVLELNKKITSARNHIHKMDGIDSSESVQQQRMENLKEQLALKKQLIEKYKHLNMNLTSCQQKSSNNQD